MGSTGRLHFQEELQRLEQQALGALVGMVMKSGKGLNPKLVQERLKQKLSS